MEKFLQFIGIFIGFYGLSQTPLDIKVKDTAGNESINVTCNNGLDANGCITLHAEYPVLKQTLNYEVTQETYNPPVAMNQGLP